MHNIRKAIVRVCLVLVFVILLQEAVRFCYQSWSSATIWSKKERKELEGTIDTVYCGTSLAYYAFNPEILDAKLGSSSFNLATASQPYMGMYYLLQETAEKNPLKQVYIAISLKSLMREEQDIHNYVSAFENMCSWKWKLKYLFDINQEEVWISSLLYSTQVDSYLAPDTVKKNLKNKLFVRTEPKNYGGRGLRLARTVFEGREEEENTEVNTWNVKDEATDINAEAVIYLQKIVDFCNAEGIELTFIAPPYSQVYVDGAGDYDGFHQYVQKKADEWGVEFYDFVLYKERPALFTNEVFRDQKHLNITGGKLFSNILAEVMQSDDPHSYFYESVNDFK